MVTCLTILCACADNGPGPAPAPPPPVPVGLMWGSGASGAMVEDTIPLVVFYRDSAGDPIGWPQPVVSWASSSPSVVRVASETTAVAVGLGTAVLTATTATAPIDTLYVALEVIPRWTGRLVWVRSPDDGGQPRVAVQQFPGHSVTQLPDLGFPGGGTANPDLTSDGRFVAATAPRLQSPAAQLTVFILDLDNGVVTAPLDSVPGNQFFPVWMPGDTLLAFLMESPPGYEVFSVRRDGSGRRQRTNLGQTVPPSYDITPEGRLILELREAGSASDLVELTLDGDTIRRLTADPGSESRVAVSPDGLMIAHEALSHVWIRARDGSNPRRLVPDARAIAGSPSHLTSWIAGTDSPSWTPDGRYVLVNWSIDSQWIAGEQSYQVRGEIYAIRAADGLAIRLTRSTAFDRRPRFQ